MKICVEIVTKISAEPTAKIMIILLHYKYSTEVCHCQFYVMKQERAMCMVAVLWHQPGQEPHPRSTFTIPAITTAVQ